MTDIEKSVPSHFVDHSADKLELIKNTVCKGATDAELEIFLHACKRTGLDPFLRQIYSVPRSGGRTIQIAIDGARLIGDRTGCYAPGREPSFSYDEKGAIIYATAYIKKMTPDGTWHEVSATAYMSEYNAGTQFWRKMPHGQLAKCAESLALRKAFPAELSGLYTNEEMEQADVLVVRKAAHELLEADCVEETEDEMVRLAQSKAKGFPEDLQQDVVDYLLKYSKHYKKKMRQVVSEHRDPEALEHAVRKRKEALERKEIERAAYEANRLLALCSEPQQES
jgi:phage recombination protein Bet